MNRWTLFPKFYRGLSTDALAAAVSTAGLDGVDLLVREGYWVEPDNFAATAPAFVKAMRAAGLEVPLAVVSQDAAGLVRAPGVLSVLGELGVGCVRIGYFARTSDPAGDLDGARRALAALAPVTARAGVRILLQLHHGTAICGSTAAWHVLRDLDPSLIGLQIDPGNQFHEGWEGEAAAVALAGAHLASVGVKDIVWTRALAAAPAKGWVRDWRPCTEGVVDWLALGAALRAASFSGIYDFQPFYSSDAPEERARLLRDEVAYVRAAIAPLFSTHEPSLLHR